MDPSEAKTRRILQDLFASQSLAVMATHDDDGQPYASLMAFVASDDLMQVLVATARSTRKYANLTADPRVALLVDSRSNRDDDVHRAVAVTVLGEAEEVGDFERDGLLRLYLAKHPHLEEFVAAPACALMRVKVASYYLVSNFREVVELHMGG